MRIVHYLPHHAVVHQDKSTTNVRVVYDASAKSASDSSLKDCFLKGPRFNQLIFDLLERFRAYDVSLIADLEKAFSIVAVEDAYHDMLRFIWVNDPLQNFRLIDLVVLYLNFQVHFSFSLSPRKEPYTQRENCH